MALTAMIALVGFELLMAQELQFVHGFSPLDAGLFMLPLMLACSFSGPAAGAGRPLWFTHRRHAGYGLQRPEFFRPLDDRYGASAGSGLGLDDFAGSERVHRTVVIHGGDHVGSAKRESHRCRGD